MQYSKKLKNKKPKQTKQTKMQKQPTYSEHLSESWFSLISLGTSRHR